MLIDIWFVEVWRGLERIEEVHCKWICPKMKLLSSFRSPVMAPTVWTISFTHNKAIVDVLFGCSFRNDYFDIINDWRHSSRWQKISVKSHLSHHLALLTVNWNINDVPTEFSPLYCNDSFLSWVSLLFIKMFDETIASMYLISASIFFLI